MQRATLIKIGKRVLSIGLPVVVLVLCIYAVRQDWNKLTAYHFQWNFWLLALSFVGFVAQEISYGLIWRNVLARLGSRIDLRTSLRIYLASEFVRYIPGNVWHVLTRILWVGKYGVPRPVAFASMMVELITKLAAGVLIFALSLLFWRDVAAIRMILNGSPIIMILGILLIFALLIGLHPRVLSRLLNLALRVLKRDPIVLTLRYSDILLITLAWCASWTVAGSAFYIMLLALWPATPLAALPICIGIYAIAWDVGFVSFITPSGLGFREGTVVALFLALPFVPTAVAAIIAILSRLVSTLAELLCVSIAYLGGGRQAREVQREQSEQSSSPEGSIPEEEMAAIDETTRVSIEGGVGSD
jgi:glycosyltransferase 2 family protein